MASIGLIESAGLALLGALVPLALLHLLKARRHRIPVGSTWLWRQNELESHAPRLSRRWVEVWSLLLHILAVIALALALARPFLREAIPPRPAPRTDEHERERHDDTANATSRVTTKLPVWLVSDHHPSWFVRAFDADESVELHVASTAAVTAAEFDPDALVVLEGVCPQKLPERDLLIVGPPAGTCLGFTVGPPVAPGTLTSWDVADPRLRYLTLDDLHIAQTASLSALGSSTTLARAHATALIVDGAQPDHTTTLVGFDVGQTDWPLQNSFVFFIRNITEVTRFHRDQRRPHANEVASVEAPTTRAKASATTRDFGQWISLGAAILLAIELAAWFLRHRRRLVETARLRLVVACGLLALTASAMAAMDPEVRWPSDGLTVLLTIDRSRSIDLVPNAPSRVGAELNAALKEMKPNDRLGTVVFGAQAATEDPPHSGFDTPLSQHADVGRDGTDLQTAILHALEEIPVDSPGRIVLVTDGVQTRGDAISAAAAARDAGVPIDILFLDQKTTANIHVSSIRAPWHANQNEPLELKVVTSSTIPAGVIARVKRDGALIETVETQIGAGEDVISIRVAANSSGLHRYDVDLIARDPATDALAEDNRGSAFVRIEGQSSALMVEGVAGKATALRRALEVAGFHVEVRSAPTAPITVEEFGNFDLLVINDVLASALMPSQLENIARYVRDLGGGLLLMGGERSMGPGGFGRTPIEEVSPLSFDLRESNRRPSLAEVIAIDTSGSMGVVVGGKTKLSLANEAAARSTTLLGSRDRIGVEHVDDHVTWTIPLVPVVDADSLGETIRQARLGGGGIYTDLALQTGYAALSTQDTNLKHLLLFADGDDAERIAGCRALVSHAAENKITTSVISLGRGHDTPELAHLARLGGGRFYAIEDATRLPAVFLQETILAAHSAIEDVPFRVRVQGASSTLRGIDWPSAPPLGGHVVTLPKPRATLLLLGPEDDPVLATWAIGTGRVGAFTSDYQDHWGGQWRDWPGAGALFSQLALDLARKVERQRVRVESTALKGELRIRADVVGADGRMDSTQPMVARVIGPDGFELDVPLASVGGGHYDARVALSRPGTYLTAIRDRAKGDLLSATGAVFSTGDEWRPSGSDRALLERVAAISGGQFRDTLTGIFNARSQRPLVPTSLRLPLILLATVALLAGVAARRLAMPHWVTRWLRPSSKATPAPTPVADTELAARAEPPPQQPLTTAEALVEKRRQRQRDNGQ